MDANPKLKLIQRIGARADAIDLAAAKQRGILVSCVPRATCSSPPSTRSCWRWRSASG
jgi:phosphoglycerate dehydrogenase-like enzyme